MGATAPESPDLFGAVLASVSRSFYLTIRILPRGLRRPVGLAYLLARLSDTIADSAGTEAGIRIAALDAFGNAIRGAGPAPDFTPLMAGVADPAERTLLDHAGVLIDLLRQTAPDDQADIVRVLDEILRGQTLDVRRFPTPGGGSIRALAHARELEEYTYSVAGCVGEFWTRICLRHLPRYARREPEEMLELGVAFGKGLQLVNILRDLPADLRNGRCYLPEDELAAVAGCPAGMDLGGLLRERPALIRPVYLNWLSRAREGLDAAFRYIDAVRPWRLRLACFLPWAIGTRTVRLLERFPALETPERIKVSRPQVRRMIMWGMFAALSGRVLRIYSSAANSWCVP